ncbi:hypothetical protein Pcac1_g10254 [Phytophthora cactorum]|uniref:Uncharacterized protein n=1 Tax=Phytophthora cactorum TaxID=29920 RepID=A0A329S6D8_9STRA|nr:hypothetical protein Pcac1_g10254 [Phytophthora cactorum]KAG2838363.1 hypothetical protein PC112_g4551 [Phytophthora cactorum]KAG2915963.1 hypothetical protein PC114_g7650 [Phytophthora cactorum]KAG3026518.1 hypothetical protein PC119_g7786 [Phytophthora cactorum]KAG3028922.1 hypothetical protein PC120_g4574 [Phytophthora cactorum]
MAGSDRLEGAQRMQLGPSGSHRASHEEPKADLPGAVGVQSSEGPKRLQTFFNSVIDRFLKAQRAIQGTPIAARVRVSEVQRSTWRRLPRIMGTTTQTISISRFLAEQ